MLKKEEDKLANPSTKVPEQISFSWNPLDAVALALFVTVIMLFFV